MDKTSPKILAVTWGYLEVDGLSTGKDYKLFPGGGRFWDWIETGTQHKPGIQPADVEELISHGATTVVLSQGMDMKLHVDQATLTFLQEKGITVHVAETRQAVTIYNTLAEKKTLVGGLFHSTC